MIYTVTLNPSLDYTVFVDDIRTGATNRTTKEAVFAGGKGLNVSTYLKECGIRSVCLGFLAGFTGDEIRRLIRSEGLEDRMITVKDGMSRINVKIKSTGETEINGRGPEIEDSELDSFMAVTDELTDGDILIMSGSVPPSLPKDIYAKITARLTDKDIKVIVDAERDLLLNTLKYDPFLIKPNDTELSQMTGHKADTYEEAFEGAGYLQSLGARNVIVSMGGKGAVLLCEDGRKFVCEAAEGTVINTVGAGDCLLAGFVADFLITSDPSSALRSGVAAGCACAFSEGLAEKEYARQLTESLRAYRL